MGNGKPVRITHTENESFSGKRQLYLHSLLRVPQIKKKLLSVSRFAKYNRVFFEFFPQHYIVKDILTKEIILQGKECNGLYKFNMPKSRNPECKQKSCNLSEIRLDNCRDFDIQHYNLGNPSVSTVKQILSDNNIQCENIKVPYICTFCQRAKNHELAFSDSNTKYDKPQELLATNLWGPSPINTDYGYKYYISFVDAFSRYTWIFFLKSKSETSRAIIQFISLAERQTKCTLKIIQSDGGTEFLPLKNYFHKKGITHKTTCPYTSE